MAGVDRIAPLIWPLRETAPDQSPEKPREVSQPAGALPLLTSTASGGLPQTPRTTLSAATGVVVEAPAPRAPRGKRLLATLGTVALTAAVTGGLAVRSLSDGGGPASVPAAAPAAPPAVAAPAVSPPMVAPARSAARATRARAGCSITPCARARGRSADAVDRRSRHGHRISRHRPICSQGYPCRKGACARRERSNACRKGACARRRREGACS